MTDDANTSLKQRALFHVGFQISPLQMVKDLPQSFNVTIEISTKEYDIV